MIVYKRFPTKNMGIDRNAFLGYGFLVRAEYDSLVFDDLRKQFDEVGANAVIVVGESTAAPNHIFVGLPVSWVSGRGAVAEKSVCNIEITKSNLRSTLELELKDVIDVYNDATLEGPAFWHMYFTN